MIKLNNTNANIIAIVSISIITLLILSFINDSKKEQTYLLKQVVINEAKQSFIDIVITRKWNAHYGGVFVRQQNGLEPNPFLLNNETTTISGEKLIKINHAWMTKQISQIHDKSDQITYKLTSLKPLNPENTPNKFEERALRYFEKNKEKEYYYNADEIFEKETFSFMGKLLVEKSCLECHAMQGYKEGEVRGGIHVNMNTDPFKTILEHINTKHFYFNLLVFIFALFAIIAVYKLNQIIFKQKDKLEMLNHTLEDKIAHRTKELHDLNRNLEVKIQEAVKENQQKEELMIAQSRHAAMGEMISMIAHQWRQPIAAISMGANNIILDIELDDIDKKNFDNMAHDILGQTKYLTKTIDDFSNFFKPIKEKNLILPSDVIEESISIIGKSLENNGIKLEKAFSQTDQIETYSRELLQVLINIIKNAKEAFEHSNTQEKKVLIALEQTDQTISIHISDNAGGIPKDIIDKIFDPYFSTKKEKNGTGLGLYMSKTIVNKHLYGDLSVQNTDEGAMFTIELPKDNK